MRSVRTIVLVLIACASGCAEKPQTDGASPSHQEKQSGFALIAKPDPKVFSEANSLEKWKNPFLFVHPDGVELIPPGPRRQGLHEIVAEIEKRLVAMPADAWPLGRAVAVQENALGSGQAQKDNAQALKAMLESHDIAINWWPTG